MTLALASLRTALTPLWVKNPLWRNARAVPTLDLRFADNKSLTDSVTGASLVTFNRASSGTYVDSAGVIQTAVTNLLLQSEDFSTTWTPSLLTVTTNAIASPSGATTADALFETTSTGEHRIRQNFTGLTANTNYTTSVYVKDLGGRNLGIRLLDTDNTANGYLAVLSPVSGTVVVAATSLGSGVAASTSITPLAGGWYRVTLTGNAGATCTKYILDFFSYSGTSANFAGDITKGIYIWGAQLEQSSTVGEYIPTTSAINSAPRFDHNPTTGESLGLLVEESRTNLSLTSEDFSGYVGVGTVSTNSATSPAGTSTADKLIATNGGTNGQCSQGVTIASGATVTGSVFVKAGGFDRLELVLLSNSNTTPYGRATVNPNTGAITSAASTANGGTNASASVVDYGNGWYRFAVTVTYPAVTAAGWRLNVANSDFANGDGIKGVFLWGMQLEAGAFPTSYIKNVDTVGGVTRSADVASITGSAFSSWYRQDEGTVFAQYDQVAGGGGRICEFSDGSTSFIPFFVSGSAKASLNIFVSGVNSGRIDSGTAPSPGVFVSAIASFAPADRALCTDGGLVTTSTSPATLPVLNAVQIGADYVGGSRRNGRIRRLTYWRTRLPNSTLQQITQ